MLSAYTRKACPASVPLFDLGEGSEDDDRQRAFMVTWVTWVGWFWPPLTKSLSSRCSRGENSCLPNHPNHHWRDSLDSWASRIRYVAPDALPLRPLAIDSLDLQRDGKVASCELRFVPLGNEVRMLRNGSVLMSRIFESGEVALAWAEEERQRMLGHDWSLA